MPACDGEPYGRAGGNAASCARKTAKRNGTYGFQATYFDRESEKVLADGTVRYDANLDCDSLRGGPRGLDMVFTRPILPAPFDTSWLLGDDVLVVAVDEETEGVVDLDATVFSQFWKDRCVPAIDDPVRGQDQEEPAPRAPTGADTVLTITTEAAVEEDPTVIEEHEQDVTEIDSNFQSRSRGAPWREMRGVYWSIRGRLASCGDGESRLRRQKSERRKSIFRLHV